MAKAKYKVWITVKDSYGNTKELDGGNVDINLDEEAMDTIVDNIKDNIIVDAKSPVYVPEVTKDNMLKFKLTDDATKEELEFDIDKTNDWNKMDSTVGSSYLWEQLKNVESNNEKPNNNLNKPESNTTKTYIWEPME